MTGPTQFMAMSKKLSPTTALNPLANQLLLPPHLMPIFSIALLLVHPSLHVSISAIDWYSKKQATVETATYSSKFVAAKTATEEIIDLRYTLRYLSVPIKAKSYMFGDNRSVVTSATVPHSTLSKRHNILAFHRVREAMASNICDFHWIQSKYNLSDMLSKHWEHIKIFPMIRKLIITCGPITLIPRQPAEETSKQSK